MSHFTTLSFEYLRNTEATILRLSLWPEASLALLLPEKDFFQGRNNIVAIVAIGTIIKS